MKTQYQRVQFKIDSEGYYVSINNIENRFTDETQEVNRLYDYDVWLWNYTRINMKDYFKSEQRTNSEKSNDKWMKILENEDLKLNIKMETNVKVKLCDEKSVNRMESGI